jgi:hypothetical protein
VGEIAAVAAVGEEGEEGEEEEEEEEEAVDWQGRGIIIIMAAVDSPMCA